MLRGEGYSRFSDIWSVGCTMIEMLTGYPPNWCDESDPIKIMNLIAHSNTIPDFPDEISEDCLDFLEQCINRIPSKRLTAKQLLTHPFITSTAVKIKDL